MFPLNICDDGIYYGTSWTIISDISVHRKGEFGFFKVRCKRIHLDFFFICDGRIPTVTTSIMIPGISKAINPFTTSYVCSALRS